MDVSKYMKKQAERKWELSMIEPKNDVEKAIIDIEQIICSIRPYGTWWRWGYIKSLRIAINALKKMEVK